MASKGVPAGKAFVSFSLRDGAFRKSLRRIQKRLVAVGAGLQRLSGIGVRVGAGLAAGIGVAAKSFASVGDDLNKMSARTGFSAQALSELSFAAQQSGATLGDVEKGIRGMQRGILDAERGLSTATDNLDELGVSLDDLRGKSPEEQFNILTDAVSNVEDPSTRAAIAMKLFGRAGSTLMPMLNSGSSGIAALRAEANALGVTMGDEDAQAAADLTDAMGRLWAQVKQVAVQVGAAVAGPLTEFLAKSKPILKATIDWIAASEELAARAFTALVSAGKTIVDVFMGAWDVLSTVWSAMQTAVNATVKGLSFAFVNWSTIAQTAMLSVGLAVVRFANQTVHFFSEVLPTWLVWFANNWRDVFTDIANLTKTIAGNIWENLKSLWDGIVGLFKGEGFSFEWTPLTEGFESAIKELPKIAEREMGPLEKSLSDEIDNLTKDLQGQWEEHSKAFDKSLEVAERDLELKIAPTETQESAARASEVSVGKSSGGKLDFSAAGTFSSAAILAGALEGGRDGALLDVNKKQERHLSSMAKQMKSGGITVTQ